MMDKKNSLQFGRLRPEILKLVKIKIKIAIFKYIIVKFDL